MSRMAPYEETLSIEFKSDIKKYGDNDLFEDVVAFANTEGGDLYLGVEDDGTITGVHPEHAKHHFLNLFSEESEAHLNKKSSRGAKGGGSIRKRENGLWEARYTTGFDAKTGKQIQKSIYGKTQKEVRQKLSEVIAEIDRGDYCEPCQMSINQWLDIWLEDYTTGIKDSTRYLYERQAKLYIHPSLGNTKLNQLETHSVQRLYNQLGKENELSPKSIKNVHGILHRALQQAQRLGYIRSNPTEACILPRVTKKDISPMTDQRMGQFLEAIKGHQYELFFKVDLFTGMQSESSQRMEHFIENVLNL